MSADLPKQIELIVGQRGWPVIPLNDQKKPFGPWKAYQSEAPTMEQVERWHRELSPQIWAIVTGAISGHVLLDFDGDEGRRMYEAFDLDAHVSTPRGGYHVRIDHPGWKVKTWNSGADNPLKREFPGLDIRADGGYAGVVGSTKDGSYKILRQQDPFPLDVARQALPDRVLELIGLDAPPPEPTEHERTVPLSEIVNGCHQNGDRVDAGLLIDRALAKVAGGEGRNDAGAWLAMQLRDNNYAEFEAESVMLTYREHAGPVSAHGVLEPYSVNEVKATLRSVYSRPPRDPWQDKGALIFEPRRPTQARTAAEDEIPNVGLVNEEGQVLDVDQCPDPVPFTTVLPAFPTDVFPPWLREFVESEAIATQTPADLAAFFAFGAISTATANRVDVEAREGWREPVHLWLLVALLPGERKSPVFRDVMEPLYRYQREERERQGPELRLLEQKHRVASARLAKAEKGAVNAADAIERSRADAEIETAQEELDKLDVPAPFQLLADDVTAEAFAIAMHAHGRITIASAEGGIFENFSGRYSKGIPNLDALLKSHGAEHITITRVSREQLLIDRACATLALAVQPIVLSGLNSQPIMRGRGLLARFLLCLPQSRVGQRSKNPPPVADHVKQTYQRRIVELLEGIQPKNDPVEDRRVPHVLTLTPAAAARLSDWAGDWLESQLGERGRLSGITDWANKLAGAAVRIAGVLHFAEHGAADGLRETISLDTINAALRVAEYLIPHAQAALDLFDEDEATSNARTILAWITDKRPDEVSASIVQRTLNRIKSTADAEPALEILAHRNFLLPVPKPPPGPKGGHPWKPRWTPNPKLWTTESTYTTYTTASDQGCVGSVGGFRENEDADRGDS